MGILDRLGLGRSKLDELQDLVSLGIKSPWVDGNGSLSAIILSELIGSDVTEHLPLTREEALSIPAVSKARNLLVATAANWPLTAWRYNRDTGVDEDITSQHPWLYRTNGIESPYDRMANSLEDVFFEGCSLWVCERGESDKDGRRPITAAAHLDMKRWTVTEGHILVDEKDIPNENIILFNPPYRGLLNVGNRTLRGARDTERAWVGRMRNPIPLIELRVTDDTNLSQEEVDAFVRAWAAARKAENGAVNFTPPGIEIETHGEVSADLFVEARNSIRTDVGSFVNFRASMLDGTTGIDSLTYTTKDGEKNLFYELDMPFWSDPFEARLSQDDVLPRGQRIRFDKYAAFNLPTRTGTPVED